MVVLQVTRQFIINPYILTPVANTIKIKGNNVPNQKELSGYSIINKFQENNSLTCYPKQLQKFLDSSNMIISHSICLLLSISTLNNEPWFYDQKLIGVGVPFHEVTSLSWWYYITCATSYFTIIMFVNGDGLPSFLHHLATIILLLTGWVINLIRVGVLILFLHGFGDLFFQVSKLFDCVQWPRAKRISRIVFVLSFGLTKILLYPILIIKNLILYFPHPFPPVGQILVFCLCMVWLPNIYWFYLIAKKMFYPSNQKF